MTFAELGLNPSILKAVTACGYTTPTPVQEQAIPLVRAGHDLIATAGTGTGKTAAFVLPALERLSTPSTLPGKGPRLLVLTPTRELAQQVMDAARNYGGFMRLRCGSILGGMPYRDQLRLLSGPVDIIVATPGRLVDHLDRGSIKFDRLEMLVLDEADRMLDMGFSEDVERIVGSAPEKRQTLMFTATMDNTVDKLARRMLRDPQRVELTASAPSHQLIDQRLHVADNLHHKKAMLRHLINDKSLSRAIIFSATKRDADELAQELCRNGHSAAALHGDMNQAARNRTISNVKAGRVRLLVATDVAARGLDVNGISHVINFDLPRFAEDYVHRIGRTGRAGATGTAISFVSQSELAYLDRIERFIGKELPQHSLEGHEPMTALRRVGRGNGAGRGRSGAPSGKGGKGYANAGGATKSGGKPWSNDRNGQRSRTGSQQKPVVVEYRNRRSDS
ncbi:DEAD/DEAH box helicase [Geobacter argillaceus]|uniref:Superfamily II DNA/RNA helicase n=1 Tax=Geobacter argillaceus TaxID=345631 RepID=A0A562VPE3_9BACT|nr:DEAD/DEAH box helicase [Geobacter argillaceus]TWJ19805.1 superfamily II DNA/RNA helicase [Geobacter argillaceus]